MASAKPQIIVLQEREFKVAYKKLHQNQKKAVNTAVLEIVDNPLAGVEKKGDLKGVYVYKFKCLDRTFFAGLSMGSPDENTSGTRRSRKLLPRYEAKLVVNN